MSKLKFLVRYEGLDGNEDCEKVYTLEDLIRGRHEDFCIQFSKTSKQIAYKIEEIQSFNFDGWISVEDDLPGTYFDCLCFDGEDYLIGYLSINNEWWDHRGVTRKVTHWQYLPNQPNHEKP